MSTCPTAVAPHERIDEASAVHAWRVKQLIRLGLAWPVAEVVADRVDWHAVAKLVRRGCPVSLAVAIIELSGLIGGIRWYPVVSVLAQDREAGMTKDTKGYPGAARFLPGDDASLPDLAEAAQSCQGCDLYERATQTVFGHGTGRASVVLIGEQPGDAEDRAGKPFVGPAGKLLDRALEEAGIPPGDTYTTNAVKHFRWKPAPQGGKRRIHQRPEAWQVRACWPWLAAELSRLAPGVVVTLGATAGQALFGSSFRVSGTRGTPITWHAPALPGRSEREVMVVPTVHPSAILRADDREAAYAGLVGDLRVAASSLHG